jgi:hypothetical protein
MYPAFHFVAVCPAVLDMNLKSISPPVPFITKSNSGFGRMRSGKAARGALQLGYMIYAYLTKMERTGKYY